MARDHARVLLAIWQDPDWRKLSAGAQRMYVQLLSWHSLSYAGSMDYLPKRLAQGCGELTPQAVEHAVDELAAARFVLIDRDTDELLIRSFLRHDKLHLQPNMMRRVEKDYVVLQSEVLRAAFLRELRRFHAETPDAAGWKGCASLLVSDAPDPDPKGLPNPSVNPDAKGSATRVRATRVTPAPAPAPAEDPPTPQPQPTGVVVIPDGQTITGDPRFPTAVQTVMDALGCDERRAVTVITTHQLPTRVDDPLAHVVRCVQRQPDRYRPQPALALVTSAQQGKRRPPRSTTDERVAATLALAAELKAQGR